MRTLLAAAACAALASSPATAHPTYDYTGKCQWLAVAPPTADETYSGVIHGAVGAVEAASGLPAPAVPIEVTCELRAGTTRYGGTSASGTGVAAAVSSVRYADPGWPETEMCTRVVVGGDAHESCVPPTRQQVPPDTNGVVWWALETAFATVDPVACRAFVALHGAGVPGVEADGDVYAAGEPVWYCPPYDESR